MKKLIAVALAHVILVTTAHAQLDAFPPPATYATPVHPLYHSRTSRRPMGSSTL